MIASRTSAVRAGLTVDRIIDAALNLTAQYGAALSMRRLAADLGVEPMSLYHHVQNKQALVTLMADRALSVLSPPDDALPWDQQLMQLVLGLYRAGSINPAVIPALTAELAPPANDTDSGPAAAAIDQIMHVLQQSPVPATLQHAAGGALIKLVIGALVTQPPKRPPAIGAPVAHPQQPRTGSLTSDLIASSTTQIASEALTELQVSVQWVLLGMTTGSTQYLATIDLGRP